MPFHGFVSVIQNDILIGFILKSNFFQNQNFLEVKHILLKSVPYIEDIEHRNTSGSDIDNIDIKSFINKCRGIMGIKPLNSHYICRRNSKCS